MNREFIDALQQLALERGVTTEEVLEAFKEALRKAYSLAQPGDTVLLSPACASFDQYRDYAHRGEAFKAAFQKLREESAVRKT